MKTLFGMAALVVGLGGLLSGGGAAGQTPPRFPSPFGEPAGRKIEWKTNVVAGYQLAVKEKKLLVVYFRHDYCESCMGPCKHCKPIDDIVKGTAAGALADRAVWVWTALDKEKGEVLARLMQELEVKSVPTVVVLEVSADSIKERGRVVGKLDPEKFLGQLKPLLGGEVQ